MNRLSFQEEDSWVGVYNKKKELLGCICYDYDWKCFVWEQEDEIQMSLDCLHEVCIYIQNLKEEGK